MSAQSVELLVQELEELCGRGELSLAALKRKLTAIPPSALCGSPFFHSVCNNRNVTLEIVDYILKAIPEAAHITTARYDDYYGDGDTLAYPVHLACINEFCPHSVIQLLVEKNPAALGHPCLIHGGVDDYYSGDEEGFPLHYYFTRTAHKWEPTIDLDTVKMLVRAWPESLAAGQDESTVFVPILFPLFWNHHSSSAVSGSLSDIVQYIESINPSTIRSTTYLETTPVHTACKRGCIDVKTMEILLGAWPESARIRDQHGSLPIHELCQNYQMNGDDRTAFLSLLVEAYPQSTMESDENRGWLPIHHAVASRSPAPFCEALIEANPASLRTAAVDGHLPIHTAVCSNLDDPDGIIQLLLKKDPDSASTATCLVEFFTPAVSIVEILFDAFPEALCARDGNGQTPLDVARGRGRRASEVTSFLEAQMAFVREAQNDGNLFGLALRALNDNAPLGTIKLLVKHDPSSLQEHDEINGSLLHCACRGGNWRATIYLLEARGSLAAERDADNKLPLHLLWECNEDDVDRNNPGYLEAVWKLLLANPADALLGFQ